MFGYIRIETAAYPSSMKEKLEQMICRIRKSANIKVQETEICGFRMDRCTVTLPYGINGQTRTNCLRRAAEKLYRIGVRSAAIGSIGDDRMLLRQAGIRIADASRVYRDMYLPMLRRLMEILELPAGEGRLIVYAKRASREVLSFCESAVHTVRYITVLGPGLMQEIGQRLLDNYGIAACPQKEDGIIDGDVLVCFDLPDEQTEPLVKRILVRGAMLPYQSDIPAFVDTFAAVNDADFFAEKYMPYAVAERDADQVILSFLYGSGCLKCRDLEIASLRSGMRIIAEKRDKKT